MFITAIVSEVSAEQECREWEEPRAEHRDGKSLIFQVLCRVVDEERFIFQEL